METERTDETWEQSRRELRRAYLLVGFGNIDEAIEICRKVDERLESAHHLPGTMEGEFLVAKGDLRGALGRLREVTRSFPDEPLPRLHFAEACYLDGRTEQGSRALERARELDDGEHAEFAASLEETWCGVEPEEIPPPVRVEQPE